MILQQEQNSSLEMQEESSVLRQSFSVISNLYLCVLFDVVIAAIVNVWSYINIIKAD